MGLRLWYRPSLHRSDRRDPAQGQAVALVVSGAGKASIGVGGFGLLERSPRNAPIVAARESSALLSKRARGGDSYARTTIAWG